MLLYYFILCITTALLSLWSKNRKTSYLIGGVFLAGQLLAVADAFLHINAQVLDFFLNDGLAVLFFALMSIIAIPSYIHSIHYSFESDQRKWNLLQFAFILLSGCLTGAYLSNHMVVTWIFVEASTLASAILVYHKRNRRSLEATWKYIFVCSLGIAIAYFGILFMSIMLRGIPEANLSYPGLILQLGLANPLYLKLAFIFILVGYSCKAEIFPLFSIGIDANQMAPTSISGFFSTAMTNMGLIAILRIYQVLEQSSVFDFVKVAMLLTGSLSLITAALYTQRTHHYKRLMAYSTVENMGLVFVGLGIGGLGYYAAILHVIIHSFVKSAAFFQLGMVGRTYHSYSILKSGSYGKIHPAGATILLICTIGVLALPPSGLFISELLLLKAMIASRSWLTLVITTVSLCFVLYAVGNKIGFLIFNPLPEHRINEYTAHKNNWLLIIQIALLLIGFSACFYQAPWLQNWISGLAASL